MQAAARHRCMIYDGAPGTQIPHVARTLIEQLRSGARCFYLNSPDMIAEMWNHLAGNGIDIDAAVEKGSLILSSDRGHLIEGRFDSGSMLSMLVAVIEQAQRDGFDRICMTGDMTWEFGDESNLSKLLEYERALEDVLQLYPGVLGICQYHRATLPTKAVRDALCSHQSVYINQTLFRANPYFRTQNANEIPTDISDLLVRFNQFE